MKDFKTMFSGYLYWTEWGDDPIIGNDFVLLNII